MQCLKCCACNIHTVLNERMKALNEKNKRKHAASVIKSRIKYTSEMKLEIDATEATAPFSEVTFDCLNLHFKAFMLLPRALFRRYICLYVYIYIIAVSFLTFLRAFYWLFFVGFAIKFIFRHQSINNTQWVQDYLCDSMFVSKFIKFSSWNS